jgi:Tol biopolymer transport system component
MNNRSARRRFPQRSGHSAARDAAVRFLLPLGLALLFGCGGPRVSVPPVSVQIRVDSGTRSVSVPSGSTVSEALAAAAVSLGPLDEVSPPVYGILSRPTTIQVTRVTESDEVEESPVPYPQQIVRSLALAPGETRLVQAGVEGKEETTYRIVTQDGREVSRSPVSSMVVQPATPEILMEGNEASIATVPIPGTLAYLDGGNAWILKGDSSSPLELSTGGNLDGRVFSLSPSGEWLLYTVRNPAAINSLKMIQTDGSGKPVDLGVADIIQFAAFSPADPSLLAYSTAAPSPAAPGWKANNDLGLLHLNAAGQVLERKTLLPPQVGGAYGWWGTRFAWSPDGQELAYARADSVGLVDATSGALTQLSAVVPYETLSDWAWVPPLAWTPDGSFLLTVTHGAPIGLEVPEASPEFDLVALSVKGGYSVTLQEQAGMFSDPVVVAAPPSGGSAAPAPQIVFLQAILPLESSTSSYTLEVMNRDGSSLRRLFPAQGEEGLAPQNASGSPDGKEVALVYQGNLWLVDLTSRQSQPLTADQLVTAADWR